MNLDFPRDFSYVRSPISGVSMPAEAAGRVVIEYPWPMLRYQPRKCRFVLKVLKLTGPVKSISPHPLRSVGD